MTPIIQPATASYIQADLTNLNASNLTSGTTAVARGGTGVATLTANQIVVGNGTSAVSSIKPIFSPGGGLLPNAKCVNLTRQNTAGTGNIDLNDAVTGSTYTVPAGKIAVVGRGTIFNNNAATATFYVALKVSGTYYQISITATATSGNAGTLASTSAPIVLAAGDVLAVNCDKNAINVWMSLIEADDTSAIKTARILSLSNGDNTLYTCPAGKSAIILGPTGMNALNAQGAVGITNNSGAGRNYYLNIVTNGGSPATANKMMAATTINNATSTSITLGASFGAGDFLNMNTTSGTATQTAWVTVLEY
jgi:hypothetical protein